MSAESVSGESRPRHVELGDPTESDLANTLGHYGLAGAGTGKSPYKKVPMHDGYTLALEVEYVLNGSGWPGEFSVDQEEQSE